MLNKILSVDKTQDVDSTISLISIVILGMVNIAILYVAPVLIGAMVEVLEFSEAQAGYVISAELLGMLLATFPALYYINRINWRKGIFIALTLMICGGLFSASIETFQALFISRFLFGLAAGFFHGNLFVDYWIDLRPRSHLWLLGDGSVSDGRFGFVYFAKLISNMGLWFCLYTHDSAHYYFNVYAAVFT